MEDPLEVSGVVAVSCLSSPSSAVGPIMTVPSTVGMTSTPLEVREGTGNTTRVGGPAEPLSRMNSSPLRGVMTKDSAPNMADTVSAWSPAAFTTHRALIVSPVVLVISQASPRRTAARASQPTRSVTPLETADSARAKANRYGSMMPPDGA